MTLGTNKKNANLIPPKKIFVIGLLAAIDFDAPIKIPFKNLQGLL